MITHRSHFFRVICTQHLMAALALTHLAYTHEWVWIGATFVAWLLCYVIGEGIFLHRYYSHRAFETHPVVAKAFAVFALLGGFGTPTVYRAVHVGMHHSRSDREGDSHSPREGFWHAYLGWHLRPLRIPLIISRNLMRDKFYQSLDLYLLRIWFGALMLLALIDWRLPLYTMGLAGAIGINMAGLTNSLGHLMGSRRFETPDDSRNLAWLSWLTWQGSGGLHNNHHAHPARYHDSHAWYEFDIGRWIVPLLATEIRTQDRG